MEEWHLDYGRKKHIPRIVCMQQMSLSNGRDYITNIIISIFVELIPDSVKIPHPVTEKFAFENFFYLHAKNV